MAAHDPAYEVTATLTASTSVQEFSKIFEGLAQLHRSGRIRFAIRPSAERSVPRVLRLDVRNQGGETRTIAIDIADSVDLLDPALMSEAQVYFKRSLTPSLSRNPKVRPFGLNNPAIRPRTALAMLRARLRTGRDKRQLAVDARQLFALPSPSAFEHSPEETTEPSILFQTRLWEPGPTDPDAEQINEERAALIRSLRAAFGHRFLGGAIPTTFAKAHYPDVMTLLSCSMRAYPRLLKRPLVTVYSRGLLDSVAFKMSEYLAASRCIVGHAPPAILPEPLVAGRNYLGFETPDQCVARCDQLLTKPELAAEMRRANRDYYRRSVEPAAHVLNVLERAFAVG